MTIPFFRHNLGAKEKQSVSRVLDSIVLTTGEKVAEFEQQLGKYVGGQTAVGLTSCTGALHLSLIAAGVKAGDEVITTSLSFVATSHAILMAGATPVFVDVEPETGNIDISKVEKAITKKTKAIIPVHLYGQMVDMKRLLKVANKKGIPVIEDAAHALEASRDGIRVGSKSFGACFSFYATKSITSGEGGAFVSTKAQAAKLVRKLRIHGVDKELAEREKVSLGMYDVPLLGWKYNMDNIQAALLVPQLANVTKVWKRRTQIAKRYRAAFESLPLQMPTWIVKEGHAHHLFPIWVDPKKRDTIALYLRKNGIGVSVNNYPAIHLLAYYRKHLGYKKGMYPVAEDIGQRSISLPLYAKLTDKEVDYIIRHVTKAVTTL